MDRTDARLVARLHVDHGHVSSAVCMRGWPSPPRPRARSSRP